jgi:hypothetical protein
MRGYVDTPYDPHLGIICEPIESLGQSKGATRMSNLPGDEQISYAGVVGDPNLSA